MARTWPVTSLAATARAAAPGPHPISSTRECGRNGSASTIAWRRGDNVTGRSSQLSLHAYRYRALERLLWIMHYCSLQGFSAVGRRTIVGVVFSMAIRELDRAFL